MIFSYAPSAKLNMVSPIATLSNAWVNPAIFALSFEAIEKSTGSSSTELTRLPVERRSRVSERSLFTLSRASFASISARVLCMPPKFIF